MSSEAKDAAPEPRETMTTEQAAKILDTSRATVIRLCEAGAIEHRWTSPGTGREDRNGHPLRGHRRLYADSVRAYAGQRDAPTTPEDSSA
jgi:hypothetical protein